MGRRSARYVAVYLLSTALACAAPPSTVAPAPTVRLLFEPRDGPIDFGAVPFPDDQYLVAGHVAVGALPGSDRVSDRWSDAQRAGLNELTGFGATTPVYFRADGPIDPQSLPATPSESLGLGSSVFMLDVDSGSPDALRRIPVEVRWLDDIGMLAVRPWLGHPLHEGRAYAVVVTSDVRASDGTALGPSELFASVRDTTRRPADPIHARAWMEYEPVLAALSIPRDHVAGLAVFHVQRASADLVTERALVRARPAAPTIRRVTSGLLLEPLLGVPAFDAPGVDVPGGVAHTHVGWLVDATIDAPWFLSTSGGPGTIRRDAGGAWIAVGSSTVWMTIAIPLGSARDVPVVLFVHDLGSERSEMLAIADALCGLGTVVVAIDLPFHGMRAASFVDDAHRFGSELGPDLFAEVNGDETFRAFIGLTASGAAVPDGHAALWRDALRQSALDVVAALAAIDAVEPSWLASEGGPVLFDISAAPATIVASGLSGSIALAAAGADPRVSAVALFDAGGDLTRVLTEGASYGARWRSTLTTLVGLDAPDDAAGIALLRFRPELAIHQTILDGADPGLLAPWVALQPVRVMLQMPREGEETPDAMAEGLARALGAALADDMPRFTDLGATVAPVSGNVVSGSTRLTRALVVVDPATSRALTRRADARLFEHPLTSPPTSRSSPESLANPTDAVVDRLEHFLATLRFGVPEVR